MQGEFVISGRPASLRGVSDPSDELAKRLLSAFELGPSWARSDAPAKKPVENREDEAPRERRERDDQRGRRDFDRRDGDRRGGGGGQREFRGGGGGNREGGYRPQRGGDRDRDRRGGGGGRDFGPRELYLAVADFQQRSRRFGRV